MKQSEVPAIVRDVHGAPVEVKAVFRMRIEHMVHWVKAKNGRRIRLDPEGWKLNLTMWADVCGETVRICGFPCCRSGPKASQYILDMRGSPDHNEYVAKQFVNKCREAGSIITMPTLWQQVAKTDGVWECYVQQHWPTSPKVCAACGKKDGDPRYGTTNREVGHDGLCQDCSPAAVA